jgi:hypothetical protein
MTAPTAAPAPPSAARPRLASDLGRLTRAREAGTLALVLLVFAVATQEPRLRLR